jgi:hypothetical protein
MRLYPILAACALIWLPAFAQPAFAQTVEQDGANDSYGLKTERAERVFLKYHRSIHAEEACNDRSFSPSDRLAMDRFVMERMQANAPDVAVGAARLLTLSRLADNQMDDRIGAQGCDGAEVKKSLQFFDERLAGMVAAAPEKSATESPAGQ